MATDGMDGASGSLFLVRNMTGFHYGGYSRLEEAQAAAFEQARQDPGVAVIIEERTMADDRLVKIYRVIKAPQPRPATGQRSARRDRSQAFARMVANRASAVLIAFVAYVVLRSVVHVAAPGMWH